MVIHGFVLLKITKPVDEHDLQALHNFANLLPYQWTDLKHNHTATNTDGWGNKLVTIFASYLDSFIVTIKFSIIYQTRDFRLWTDPVNG
jgi:hypothetical protein